MRGSFLFQRIRKNPSHYALGKEDHQTWEERVDDLVTQSVSILRQTELIESPDAGDESGALTSTEYGDIMSKVESIDFVVTFLLTKSISFIFANRLYVSVLPKDPYANEVYY